MHKRAYYIVNGITLYRMLSAPLLIFLIIGAHEQVFKWVLIVSFFTDAIDGYLARTYTVTSKLGSKMDSIADDLTIVAAIAGIIVFKPAFLKHEIVFVIILLGLFILQTMLAFLRYHKISSFHTYIAKTAAVLQATFILLLFFLPNPMYILFEIMAVVTIIDLLEEIILVIMLPEWETNVKGLYWVIRKKQKY